jgi:ERCC4-type nuclease
MTSTIQTAGLPALPALKSLGELADMRPIIVVDTREQLPLVFTRLPSIIGALPSGDYSALGLENAIAVERKSIADLVSCCSGENRERFERELHRLRGFRFKRLLIVGSQADIEQHAYRSRIGPKAVLSTLAAFEIRFDVPVVWAGTPEVAALRVETWVWWFAREIVQQANALLRSTRLPEPAPATTP